MSTATWGRRGAGLVLASVLALVLSGCGAGAAATPSPTPKLTPPPTASPTPTPDVAAAVIARLTSMTSAQMTVTGELKVGTLAVPIEGRYDVSGADQYSTMTMTINGQKQTTEETTVGGTTYKRTNDGAWYEQPKTADTSFSVTAAIRGATDVGVVTRGGRQLHHLTPTGAAIEPTTIGIDGSGTVKVDLYAEADGTPAILSMTVDVTEGAGSAATHVSGTMDFTFVQGATPTVAAPEPVFVMYASPKGWSVGHPKDWDVTPGDAMTAIDGPDGESLAVGLLPKGSETLTSAAAGYVSTLRSEGGATITSNKAVTVGGEPARLVAYEYMLEDSVAYAGLTILTIRGATCYIVQLEAPSGSAAAGGTMALSIVGSFTLPSK